MILQEFLVVLLYALSKWIGILFSHAFSIFIYLCIFFFLCRWPPNWLCWLARLLAWTVRGTGLSWFPLCCRWYAAMIDCCKNDLSSYCIMLSSRWLQNVSWQTASSLKKCVSDLIIFLQSFNLVQISFPCKLRSAYNYSCFYEGFFFFNWEFSYMTI